MVDFKFFDNAEGGAPLKRVNLSWIGFDKPNGLAPEKLLDILMNLPATVVTLDLSANKFGLCDADFVENVIKSIRVSIETLNLSFNNLNKIPISSLISIMRSLPPTLHTLNLSNNHIGSIPLEDIQKMISVIPPSVKWVNIDYNFQGNLELQSEIKELFTNRNIQLLSYNDPQSTDDLVAESIRGYGFKI